MLEQLFVKVIELSRAASIIIVIVVLARLCLKRFPKSISYLLWSVVLFRLVCPFTLESNFSPVPNLEPVFYEYRSEKAGVSADGVRELTVPNVGGEAAEASEQEMSGLTMPGLSTSEQGMSELTMPGLSTSEQEMSGLTIPGPSTSEQEMSGLTMSGLGTSEQGISAPTIPDPSTSEQEMSGLTMSGVSTSEQEMSELTMSGVSTSEQDISGQVTPAWFHAHANAMAAKISRQEQFLLVGRYVWLAGIGILLLYCAISAVMIRNKVSVSIPLKENIYITDEAISPFVMGILSPRIYLPGCLSGEEQEYVILHEKFHIRRFDHVVKPAAFAALCIHWFNPLVWIAFLLFCKDMEMSCDEAVIRKMGEGVRADYAASLLALSTQRRIIRGIPVDFGEGDTKGRVKNLAAYKKAKKGVILVLTAGAVILIVCLASTRRPVVTEPENSKHEIDNNVNSDGNDGLNAAQNREIPDKPEPLRVSVDIAEHYVTHKGYSPNLFYIDEDHVLWGCGRNEYGQLGQGTQDYDFHEDMVKIAENVVHVDYSQRGFVIFLTEDHRLYGMGNAGCGALQQYAEFDWDRYVNGDRYYISEPYLLAVNVAYACCGRADIVCLKEDGSVWTWGTVFPGYFIARPKKIFESAVLITGGWNHHAVLLSNGTLWTWGRNEAGNCGVADQGLISEPTMVAEGVVMVWTDLAVDGSVEQSAENLVMAWTGKLKYTEHDTIAEYDDNWGLRYLNNTVIQKADGSYWVCGENVGTEEKVVHGELGDYTVIGSHEFYPCE